MGTILASQTWITPADYMIERSAFWGIALIWWTQCVVSPAPNIVMRESPFGGYRVRMTIDGAFWNNTGSAWRHDSILENLYAMAPADTTPINMGNVNRIVEFYPSLRQYVCVVQCVPSDGHYQFFRFPPALENAGLPLYPNDIPAAFRSDPDQPGIILPPLYC